MWNDSILDHLRSIHEAMVHARGQRIEDRCWNWFGEFRYVTCLTRSEAEEMQRRLGGFIKSDAQIRADYEAREAGKEGANAQG